MRNYIIYGLLIIAGLVLVNLALPLVVFGSSALIHNPNLSPFNLTAPPPASSVPAPSRTVGDATRGARLYRSFCSGCHTPEATLGPSHHSAEFKAKYPTDDSIVAVIRGGRAPMPAFPPKSLDDQDVADILSYIRTLK